MYIDGRADYCGEAAGDPREESNDESGGGVGVNCMSDRGRDGCTHPGKGGRGAGKL